MKKLFILLSNLLLVCFAVWLSTSVQDILVFDYYPSLAVFGSQREVPYPALEKTLTSLAEEHQATIAMNISGINKEGESNENYLIFGHPSTKPWFPHERNTAEMKSAPLTNYYILEGNLKIEELEASLHSLGMEKFYITSPHLLSFPLKLFSRGAGLLGLLIFLLNFIALIVMDSIRFLRETGLRRIAGTSTWSLWQGLVLPDVSFLLISTLLGLMLTWGLVTGLHLYPVTTYFIAITLLSYNVCLLLLDSLLRAYFVWKVNHLRILELIKGRLPVKSILGLLFFGQFLAVLVVTWGLSRSLVYIQVWQDQVSGQQAWSRQENWQMLGLNRSANRGSIEDQQAVFSRWYQLIREAASKDQILLVQHNLAQQAINPSLKTQSSKDYGPEGNAIYINPNYLDLQATDVEKTIRNQAHQLSKSHFLLLLPESLKSERKTYQSLYEEAVSRLLLLGEQTEKMTAQVHLIKEGQKRFIYNTTPVSYQQFLQDPIMVVLTPEATGEEANVFWGNNALTQSIYFSQDSKIENLAKKYDLSFYLFSITPAKKLYQEMLDKIQVEILSTLAGAILGIVTSLLLFNTMNAVYFAQFRKEIFLKKIAGYGFYQLHRNYLLGEVLILLLGLVLSIYALGDSMTSILVTLLFLVNEGILLTLQGRKERKNYGTLLKGG